MSPSYRDIEMAEEGSDDHRSVRETRQLVNEHDIGERAITLTLMPSRESLCVKQWQAAAA